MGEATLCTLGPHYELQEDYNNRFIYSALSATYTALGFILSMEHCLYRGDEAEATCSSAAVIQQFPAAETSP